MSQHSPRHAPNRGVGCRGPRILACIPTFTHFFLSELTPLPPPISSFVSAIVPSILICRTIILLLVEYPPCPLCCKYPAYVHTMLRIPHSTHLCSHLPVFVFSPFRYFPFSFSFSFLIHSISYHHPLLSYTAFYSTDSPHLTLMLAPNYCLHTFVFM
jgi:hypothetical protein